MRAFALEGEHRIDHVLDHARAGDLAVLGDMADQDDGRARALGEADQRLRRAAHLRDRAGRGFDHVGPHGLDRVDDDEARGRALGQRRDDVLDRGLGGELDRQRRQAEPLRAQPHLRDRFLAGNIDRAVAGLRQRRRDLDQQRRFADAGIAAEQQHRSAHEAAAGDAVEFGNAGGEPGRVLRLRRRKARARTRRPLRGGAAGHAAAAVGAFLGDGVPFAAGVALALPAAIGRAAILADEALLATGHARRVTRPCKPDDSAGRGR